MENNIKVVESMYMEYTKEVKVFVDEWRMVSLQHDKKFGAEIIASLIYFYKKTGMNFKSLDAFFSSNSINNLNFQNIIKAYIDEPFVKSFIEQKRILSDELLLGIALFHGTYELSADIEDNESLNIALELLLAFEASKPVSFMQIGARFSKIFTNIMTNYSISDYVGFERDDSLMVVLQLRALLLQRCKNSFISSDFLGGCYPDFKPEFNRILCIPAWRARINPNGNELKPNIKALMDKNNLNIRDRAWADIFAAFNKLAIDGKMVALVTSSNLSGAMDKSLRDYFVSNGYIETVVELPDMLLDTSRISLYAMVLSYNNERIRFVDASEAYVSERRKKNIDLNIFEAILQDYNSECSKEVSIREILEEESSLLPKRYTTQSITVPGIALGEICSIKRGAVVSSSELDMIIVPETTGIKYVYSKAIDEEFIDFTQLPFIEPSLSKKKIDVIDEDCLLVTRTSPFRTKMLYLGGAISTVLNGNLFALKVNKAYSKKYLIEYIDLFFKSELGRLQIERFALGNIVKSLAISDLKSIVIPETPLAEQLELVSQVQRIQKEKQVLGEKIQRLVNEENKIIKEAFNW